MVRSPDATFSASTCLSDAEPRIRVLRLDATSKICLRDEVNAWLAVEFSPPVDCGDALGMCPLWMNIPYALARHHPAGPDSIPTTIIAAGHDQMVPIEVARTFQDVLVASGYQSRLIEIPAADHLSVLIADETLETVSNVARGR